jgi:hypothetical protein
MCGTVKENALKTDRNKRLTFHKATVAWIRMLSLNKQNRRVDASEIGFLRVIAGDKETW